MDAELIKKKDKYKQLELLHELGFKTFPKIKL